MDQGMKTTIVIFKKDDKEPVTLDFNRHDCNAITGDEHEQHVKRDRIGCANGVNCSAIGYDYLGLTPFGLILTWHPGSPYRQNRVSYFIPTDNVSDVMVTSA